MKIVRFDKNVKLRDDHTSISNGKGKSICLFSSENKSQKFQSVKKRKLSRWF